jgi:hypothetical protein
MTLHPRQRCTRRGSARGARGCLGLQSSFMRHRRRQRRSNCSGGLHACSSTLGGCCCLRRRLDGPDLAGLVGHGHRIGHIVDHDGIVDVVVDDVVRRRRGHVSWRLHPYRDRPVDRHGQHEERNRRGRRRQQDELGRPRREKYDRCRRRRRKPKVRVVKHKDWAADVDDLVWRRGRNVVVDDRKSRRRLECRAQISEAPAGVPCVRPLRVTPQIRPIGRWRIDDARTPPRDRLAARGNDCPHASCDGVIGTCPRASRP